MNIPISPSRHGPLGAVLAMVAIMVCAYPISVSATEQMPTVALGENNSEAQRIEVLDLLDAADADQVVTVTVAETFQTMEGVFDLSGVDTAYSSTALTCRSAGSGIDVMTRNIQAIPPDLYALALLTAGFSDVQLAVAAPTDAPALGMTALTGVFKTWDMTSCSASGADPERRQLALEQLALIAEIGQEPGAVRQTTLIVLEAQQEVVEQEVTTEEIDSIVVSRSQAFGLDLGDQDQAAIVDFLDRLSRAEIDWGSFRNGWSIQHSDDGSGVVLNANEDTISAVPTRAAPTGVGGATGPIAAVPAPTLPASPTATPRSPLVLPPVSTPTTVDDSTPALIGTVTESGGDGWLRLWPMAAVVVPILVLGFLASRLSRATPMAWVVSFRRTSGPARETRHAQRRPAVSQTAERARRVRITRESIRS